AGQHSRNDLARVGINGQVELTPGPARPAVLLGIPFAPSEHLQPRAVEQQMQGAVRDDTGPALGEAATTPAQGGGGGNREILAKQGGSTLVTTPSAWRRPKWKTSRKVSTSSIARSE